MASFEGKTVLIGVSGGIAAYKTVELARLLVQRGANVKVVMTESGQRFVTPLTFRSVTGNPVATSMWSDASSPIPHISLSEEADLIVVAPATANVVAKMARGIADDLLSTTLLAARGTVVVAPSMNTRMYLNPATGENLEILRRRGIVIIEPGEGDLACGDRGVGRMAEPSEILDVLEREINRSQDLSGKRVVVTAGPTWERFDPVRFISNPSTGLMGYKVADEAARRGADVVLISGPSGLQGPPGVTLVRVVSAEEMKNAVMENVTDADALVMAAAVADYRPSTTASSKIKKAEGIPEISLERTEDILLAVKEARASCVMVGFAAETDDVIANAKRKLVDKGLDLIVANKVDEPDSGFGSATNLAAVISTADEEVELSMMSKDELSRLLLDRLACLI